MTLDELLQCDDAVKAATGKSGELPVKLSQTTVDLSTHTPASDWFEVTIDDAPAWRLTQTGAKKVHVERVRLRLED